MADGSFRKSAKQRAKDRAEIEDSDDEETRALKEEERRRDIRKNFTLVDDDGTKHRKWCATEWFIPGVQKPGQKREPRAKWCLEEDFNRELIETKARVMEAHKNIRNVARREVASGSWASEMQKKQRNKKRIS